MNIMIVQLLPVIARLLHQMMMQVIYILDQSTPTFVWWPGDLHMSEHIRSIQI